MRSLARMQRKAIEKLELGPGETVIDVACGTGILFPLLEERIGPSGRIVGLDLSPEMLAEAGKRVADHGWDNVTLVEAPAEEARFDGDADAALFSFTHDVLQSPEAVANVVGHLRPGGRVACTGPKLGARWNLPVNFVVKRVARPYITTYDGLDRPWRHLERHLDGIEHKDLALGGSYVAWGRVPG
jgi:demethylmenaquinone methyltransferase/2-methoxy-6-polyprenyl-1,4-benzoquinol methylase